MLETTIKETKKKPRRKKKDKSKRWSIVFVDDSDNEREEIKQVVEVISEKIIENQIYSD
jgi:hypothetical protein